MNLDIYNPGSPEERFVDPEEFNNIQEIQLSFCKTMVNQTKRQMEKNGLEVTALTEIPVEVYICTNQTKKAFRLVNVLKERGYTTDNPRYHEDYNEVDFSAFYFPLLLDETEVYNWLKELTDLAFKNDCMLQAWGFPSVSFDEVEEILQQSEE